MQSKRFNKTLNIQSILAQSSIAEMMKKGMLLSTLNDQLQKQFPPEFKGYYRIANLEEKELIIEVANATIRQGFLFKQAELLTLIQSEYSKITQLKFKINPELGK